MKLNYTASQKNISVYSSVHIVDVQRDKPRVCQSHMTDWLISRWRRDYLSLAGNFVGSKTQYAFTLKQQICKKSLVWCCFPLQKFKDNLRIGASLCFSSQGINTFPIKTGRQNISNSMLNSLSNKTPLDYWGPKAVDTNVVSGYLTYRYSVGKSANEGLGIVS